MYSVALQDLPAVPVEAHDAIQHWCAANGPRLAGPSWEIYGHWEPGWNDNPALIRTDVFYQIA
jgi:hypothetical protein